MRQYSKQLIEIFEQNIDKKIKNFYEKNKEKYDLPSMQECIEGILAEYLGESDLQEVTAVQKKVCRNKKARWTKKIMDDYKKHKINDEKNPFFFLIQQKDVLEEEQWQVLYGSKTMEDIAGELLVKIEEWKKEKNNLLIEFPLFVSLSSTNKEKAFFQDLFLNLMDITKKQMNGSLEGFYKTTPAFMTETPVFSNSKMDILMVNNNGVFEYMFDNPGYQLKISSNSGTVSKMLDEIDSTLLNNIINCIDKDFYHTRTVHTTVGNLARAIYKKPSSKHYAMVKKRLKNMMSLRYDYKDEQREASFNILDNVIFERPEIDEKIIDTEHVDIMMGNLMYQSIVNKKMVYVTANSYNSLENKLSKLLYYTLQKERIKLASQYEDECEIAGEYDYIFFSKAIMFKEKKKNKNIKLIKDSLNEFVEKKIAIESFELRRDVFIIKFMPLSESEKADL